MKYGSLDYSKPRASVDAWSSKGTENIFIFYLLKERKSEKTALIKNNEKEVDFISWLKRVSKMGK